MLRKTFKNGVSLIVANLAIGYCYLTMSILGLLPFFRDKSGQFVTRKWNTLHSLLFACVYIFGYFKVVVFNRMDANIKNFFLGVGHITWTLLRGSLGNLILWFYVISIANKRRLCDFYNRNILRYQHYRTFYGGVFNMGLLTYANVDGEEELSQVYMKIAGKVLLIHFLVIASIFAIADMGFIDEDVGFISFFGLFFMPYLLKSLTTSFLYISAARCNFLYHRLEQKLREMRGDMLQLVRQRRSPFERMTRCCEMSDRLDQLAVCYDHINETSNELLGMFRYQILLVLLASIVTTIHTVFTQYQMVQERAAAGEPAQLQMVFVNLLFVFLEVAELLLVVDIADACHRGGVRVGKTLQTLVYVQDLDIRLRRSIEAFSLQVLNTRIQISLFGMHLLDFPLVLGVLDSILSYTVIMIQFYHQ